MKDNKFKIELIEEKSTLNKKINKRIAVRAIIKKDNQLLMVTTKHGEYKFPGGGVDKNEDYERALCREVKEETGFKNIKVLGLIGETVEIRPDKYASDECFHMVSKYFECVLVSDDRDKQSLDDYEQDLLMQPVFIDLLKAKKCNEELLTKLEGDNRNWTIRDTLVMEELLK